MKIEIDIRTTPDKTEPKDLALEPYLFLLDDSIGILNIAPHEHIRIFREGNKDIVGKMSYCAMTIDSILDYVEEQGMNTYKYFIDDMIAELQRRKKWAD